MRPDIPPDKFAEWLKSLPPEKIREGNKQELKQAEEDWNKFRSFFKRGDCSICGKPLKSFSDKSPCLHWLLRPKGFKKKHFPLLCEKFTYFRIAAYVRWVASIDDLLKNINDIKQEHPGENLIDFTARYKHLTWSFSCCKADLEGHPNSHEGNFPHYHIRMNLDGKPFITYSNFHIPFHKDDLYDIELITKHPDLVKHGFSRGAGMESLLGTDEGLEAVIEHSIPTDNYEEAAFNVQTIVMAPEGETISGALIAEVQAEAKATGKTIASVLRDKLPNANIISTISPGPGVPEAKQRTGGRKKKNR
ncbi:MAG: hypothetical protein EPN88_04635 [Bacteroidetes bacterium]|nr:MAG: hypothetical protein EPN88_04635 [Bacteroidota bacterium]